MRSDSLITRLLSSTLSPAQGAIAALHPTHRESWWGQLGQDKQEKHVSAARADRDQILSSLMDSLVNTQLDVYKEGASLSTFETTDQIRLCIASHTAM